VNALRVSLRVAGGWIVSRTKRSRGSHAYRLKEDAVRRARAWARAKGCALFIHRRNGTVEKLVRKDAAR
jgi:hypothetical protein